jgi:hypothetical protein
MTLGLAACFPASGGGSGSDDDTGTTDTFTGGDDTGGGDADAEAETCSLDQPADVSGNAQIHPVTAEVDSEADLENTKLTMYTALSIVSGSLAPIERDPGQGACVDASTEITSAESSASYDLSQVETADIAQGLVGMLGDSMAGDDTFVPTATGLADGSAFDEDVSEFEAEPPAFAVTDSTLEQLASAAGVSKDDWLSNGIMLGRFLDREGNPLADVQIGTAPKESAIDTILDDAIYPNSDFTDATAGADGGATSDNGVFIVPNRTLTTFGGTKTSTDDDSLDTETQAGATQSDIVFTLELQERMGE